MSHNSVTNGRLFSAIQVLVSSAIFVIGYSGSVLAQNGDSPLLYNFDFEDGIIGNEFNISGNAPEAVRAISRSGNWSMQSFLDRNYSKVPYRTEVRLKGHQDMGAEYWVGFSLYLPPDYAPSDRWEILYQVHRAPNDPNNPPPNNPLFALEVNDGEWRVTIRYCSVYNGGRGNGQKTALDTRLGRIETGTWTDFVLHYRWAYDKDQGGFTKMWQNGNLVVDYTGPNAFNDDRGPYIKLGIYKGWRDHEPADIISQRLVYHDELKIANGNGSYDLVAPAPLGATPKYPSAFQIIE